MAKLKHAKHTADSPQELRARVDRCVAERRFQTALDLAKQLNKYEPTPEHRELVIACYFGRAKQLRDQGSTRDSATVLDAAVQWIGNDPDRLVKAAEEMAAVGEADKALQLLARLPEPKPPNRVLPLIADSAIQRGVNGRTLLPEPMRFDFDRVRQAFMLLEKGQDDAARETIQGIGLASPFLEWKLFLRGLQAYYEKDEARAIENWSRLDSTRFAARLAAPLRLPIDAAYRSAQLPDARERISRQAEKLQNNPLAPQLRNLRRLLHGSKNVQSALRDVQSILPMLKEQFPDLAHRLADIFYWEIVDRGIPEDLIAYQYIFGPPADDPEFSRMHAMGLESESGYREANANWRRYGEFLSRHPQLSQPERERANAMVWFRMAMNARKLAERIRNIPDQWLHPYSRKRVPSPAKPGAVECLRKAVELAPDWIEPAFELFIEHQSENKVSRAISAGRELLKRFPDHLPTLQILAQLLGNEGKIEESVKLIERAFNAHPLDRALKKQLGRARRLLGLQFAEQGKYPAARAAFQSALELIDPIDDLMPLCGWAACEFKAGDAAKAEELLARAMARDESRPAIDAYMAALVTLWKLPKPIKSRFDTNLKAWFSATPSAAQAASLAILFSRYQIDRINYHGIKSHEKKALALVGKVVGQPFTEPQMERLGDALTILKPERLLRKLAHQWQRDFPSDPRPLVYEIETYLWKEGRQLPLWQLRPLATRAKELADQMPAGAKRDELSARINALIEHFHDLNPFASLFDGFHGGFDDFGPDDEEWEDDDPW